MWFTILHPAAVNSEGTPRPLASAPRSTWRHNWSRAAQVTQVAANLVRLRPPSAYKGKGIRLANVTTRLKPGKQK